MDIKWTWNGHQVSIFKRTSYVRGTVLGKEKKWTYKHALIIVHLLSNCCCASPAFFLLPTRSRFNNGNQFPVVSLVTFMTSNQVSRQLTKQKLGSTRWLNLYNSVFTQSDAAAIFEKQGESKTMWLCERHERLRDFYGTFYCLWISDKCRCIEKKVS